MACCLHCLQEIAHQDCRWTQITEIAATRLNENEKPQEKQESGAWRIKQDKGLSASVVICIQGADCWGDVQYSWPGRLFTFLRPLSPLKQTPRADADRLCGSLCWTTTSVDNYLHDKEEKAKEQQFKTDKFWPMPILYQYSPSIVLLITTIANFQQFVRQKYQRTLNVDWIWRKNDLYDLNTKKTHITFRGIQNYVS